MKKFQTKPDFTKNFISQNSEIIKGACSAKDKPLLRQLWNDMVDLAKRDGQINPKSDWTQPKWVENCKLPKQLK